MTPILELDDIHTFIGQFHILEGVSLRVPVGSISVILGRNGAGKTTTLKSIMGIAPPRRGAITFEGHSLHGLRPFDIAARGIGYVPENRAIFTDLSVEENLRIAERKRGDLRQRLEMIYDLFPDLQRLRKLQGGNLSGGQQQMLTIARALVPENKLLLIDEPSEGLAPVIIEGLMAAIRELSSRLTVVLVEQNFRMATALGDRFTIIDNGRSVEHGAMADLTGNQSLIRKYLGAG